MRLNSSGSSRRSNNGSNHKLDTDRNVGYVNLVPLTGAYGNRKKVKSAIYRTETPAVM